MAELLVIAEHRQGELREITLQTLTKASELCEKHGHESAAVLLGSGVDGLTRELEGRADRVIVYDHPRLEHFDPDTHRAVLKALIGERRPLLTFLGHTPWSMDLAPALAVTTGYPLATDCVDVRLGAGTPQVVRQVYSGKMFARLAFREAAGYLVTMRAGSAPAAQAGGRRTEVVHAPLPPLPATVGREFVGFEDTGKGEVDITQAEILVSVGRGIAGEENLAQARELAGLLGGALSCSRPVVDKKWLPKYHQVGTSGKTVRPKVYLALGISGAFQHVAAIGGAGTVIAVNKDKKAPIFRVAQYGAVADLLAVVAALRAELRKA